jgi:hypothetical protein
MDPEALASAVAMPALSLPAELFDRTVAVARGPVIESEEGLTQIIDFMSKGYTIERSPEPVVSIIASATSAERSTDVTDPLELTEREAAVVATWEKSDAEEADAAPDIDTAALDGSSRSFLSTPLGRLTAAASGFTAALAPNVAPAMADTQPSQVSFPAAKIAKPFGFVAQASETGPTATASLSAEDLQACIDAGVARPTVLNRPAIYKAGLRGKQTLRGSFEYEELPNYCAPEGYIRVAGGQFEIKKGGHWVKVGPGNTGGYYGNQKQISDVDFSPTHTPGPAYVYDECVGGKFQKARLVVTSSLRTGENGHRKIVDSKRYVMPLKAHGSCHAAVRSRERYSQ